MASASASRAASAVTLPVAFVRRGALSFAELILDPVGVSPTTFQYVLCIIFSRNINPPPSSLLITHPSSTHHYDQHLSHYSNSTSRVPDDPFALCALLALGPTLAAPRPADVPVETRLDAPPAALTEPREPPFEEPALLLLELGDGLGLGGLAAHRPPPPPPQPAPVDALNRSLAQDPEPESERSFSGGQRERERERILMCLLYKTYNDIPGFGSSRARQSPFILASRRVADPLELYPFTATSELEEPLEDCEPLRSLCGGT